MSYALVTRALFTVTNAAGITLPASTKELRAYAAPKSESTALLNLDGADVSYKRTAGAGKGRVTNRYVYLTHSGKSVFFPITEAEGTAMVGGVAKLVTIVAPVAEQAPAEQAPAEQAPAAPAADVKKAPRRVKVAA